jgi:predicted metal-dependent hydrolase
MCLPSRQQQLKSEDLKIEMPILNITGKRIPYNVQRKKIKHIYLRVGSDFRLEISIPRNEKISIPRFLKTKESWIERKLEELSQMKRLVNRNTILYKGEPFRVKILRVRNVKRNRKRKGVRFYKQFLHIYDSTMRKRSEILHEFIAQKTLQSVKRDTKHWEKTLGVKNSLIAIKDMKIWGYCKNNGDLYFNNRLVCLPVNLRKYIVLHELLHLKHFNHSKRYKREMAKYFVDYKEMEDKLKNYHPF